MNAKHTAGPWAVKGSNPPRVYARDGYDIIAACDSIMEMTHEQELANARLIAAAPELLAALEQCLKIVDAYRRRSGGDGDIAAMNARAAIAKAQP